jgi:hypothetical protein
VTAPKTWDLVGAFVTCLEAITIADGYNTDAGLVATREPLPTPASQGIAVAVELEALGQPEDPALRTTGMLAGVAVRVRVAAGQGSAQQTLHALVEDVRRALAQKQSRFPAGTEFPKFRQAQFLPAADGMPWVGADLLYTAHITNRT